MHDHMTRSVRPSIMVPGAAAALVLLIACANVANLVDGSCGRPPREIAIRAATGRRPQSDYPATAH